MEGRAWAHISKGYAWFSLTCIKAESGAGWDVSTGERFIAKLFKSSKEGTDAAGSRGEECINLPSACRKSVGSSKSDIVWRLPPFGEGSSVCSTSGFKLRGEIGSKVFLPKKFAETLPYIPSATPPTALAQKPVAAQWDQVVPRMCKAWSFKDGGDWRSHATGHAGARKQASVAGGGFHTRGRHAECRGRMAGMGMGLVHAWVSYFTSPSVCTEKSVVRSSAQTGGVVIKAEMCSA